MEKNITRRVYGSVDIVKYVMAIFVVSIHTKPYWGGSAEVIDLFKTISGIAVPFFFIASGFFLKAENYRKQCHKIAAMYIVWSVLYFPIVALQYSEIGVSFFRACVLYLRDFLLTGDNYNSWHLWFLLSLFYAICFVRWTYFMKFSERVISIMVITIAAVSIYFNWLDMYTGEMPKSLAMIKCIVTHTIMNGRILQGLYYVPIGMWLGKGEPRLDKSILGLIILFVLRYAFINNIALSEILLIPLSVCFFQIVISIQIQPRSICRLFRAMSTTVYLTHMYVWMAYYTWMYRKKTFGIDSFLVTTVVSSVLACGIYYLKKVQRNSACRR